MVHFTTKVTSTRKQELFYPLGFKRYNELKIHQGFTPALIYTTYIIVNLSSGLTCIRLTMVCNNYGLQ